MSDLAPLTEPTIPRGRRGPPRDPYEIVVGKLQNARNSIVRHGQAVARHKREIAVKDAAIAAREADVVRLRRLFITESATPFQGVTNSTTSTARRGAMSELLASVWLMSQDYEVFRAVHADGFADLVAYKAGAFMLVDVKTRSKHHQTHKILSERQIKAGVRLLTVTLETGECVLHSPKAISVP